MLAAGLPHIGAVVVVAVAVVGVVALTGAGGAAVVRTLSGALVAGLVALVVGVVVARGGRDFTGCHWKCEDSKRDGVIATGWPGAGWRWGEFF